MTELTVKKLADLVGSESDKLLVQMSEAGLKQSSSKDIVTDADKKILLNFLKEQQNKSSKTISLKKTPSNDSPDNVSGTIAIKRKRVVKETEKNEGLSQELTGDRIDFKEVEKKRVAGEVLKKSEESKKKREIESKTLVKRKNLKTQKVAEKPNLENQSLKVARKKTFERKVKDDLSKKEQRELDGERFLSENEKLQHQFEKPQEFISKSISIPETITVSDLSQVIAIKGAEVVKKLMEMGVMATLNQPLDQDTAILVAEELGHKAEPAIQEKAEEKLKEMVNYEGKEEPRDPVVSVLGHVDHGKTTLLDFIRKSKVAESEAGGITQKIGAYRAQTPLGSITFIDTPGHAAFTEVRARGANSTDIVILVVAADDGLQPQTEEAISHAQAAEVPIVVAVNKMDKEEADIEKVKNQLSEKDLVPEDWGGKIQFIPVSALKGEGIDNLLEAIVLEAEVLELKAFHKGPAVGVVLDSSTEKGQGAVATVIVQKGHLKIGDIVLVGEQTKKIRNLIDDKGNQLKEAGPSVPVLISGLEDPPVAGEDFVVVTSEKMAKEISLERSKKARENRLVKQQITNLETLFDSEETVVTSINIILKTDTYGSLEAIVGSLKNLQTEEIKINVIHDAVGGINENDINLAVTTNSVVVGFNVRADNTSKKKADEESIQIFYSGIIYDLIDGVKEIIEGHLKPEIKEEVLGIAEVRDIFRSPKFGLIAGSMVLEGVIKRNKPVRVIRDEIVIFEGLLDSLRRFKDDASEVAGGVECGIGISNYSDVKEGDKIEVFERKEIKRSLE